MRILTLWTVFFLIALTGIVGCQTERIKREMHSDNTWRVIIKDPNLCWKQSESRCMKTIRKEMEALATETCGGQNFRVFNCSRGVSKGMCFIKCTTDSGDALDL